MRAARVVLGLAGVAAAAWGVALLVPQGFGAPLRSLLAFLVGGVLVHDLVLAPLTVLLGVALTRLVPRGRRAPVALAFLVWATLTVAVANVLSGQGGRPDNPSLLNRPYVEAWLALTAVLGLVGLVLVLVRRDRGRGPVPPRRD